MSRAARHLAFLMLACPPARSRLWAKERRRATMSRVLSDARRVLGEGHVAHVMAAVLDAPVSFDPRVPMLRRRPGGGRSPEDDLARLLAKSGRRVAPRDRALQQ